MNAHPERCPTVPRRSCLVLGSGRSGTSMLGGILHDAGYDMGDRLHPAVESNPKGFFEAPEINDINERILERFDGARTEFTRGPLAGTPLGRWFLNRRRNPRYMQRWLCSLDPEVEVEGVSEELAARIRAATGREHFGYKDPRFAYTLPVWEPFLPKDTRFVCVFRYPALTVRSILKEVGDRAYLRRLRIDESVAYSVYENLHAHILRHHRRLGDRFLFVHYDQVFSGQAIDRLSEFLGAQVTAEFVEPSLKRTVADGRVPAPVQRIYEQLCELAGYESFRPS